MSTEYDSAKIRNLARKIGKTADSVAEVNRNQLQRARSQMNGNLEGSAATALKESIEELASDVSNLSSRLYEIRNALNTLAYQVEEADRKARELIQSK